MIFQLECKESVECYCTETHVGVIVGVSVRINKWSRGMFGSCSQPIKANKIIFRAELEILNIQSEQQQRQ